MAGGAPPVLVGSPYCRVQGFGRNHPLAIPRVATVLRLCEELGWVDESSLHEAPAADLASLVRFHDHEYVTALRDADAAGQVTAAVRERFGFGTLENPLFPGVFTRAATAVGGSTAPTFSRTAIVSSGSGGRWRLCVDEAVRFQVRPEAGGNF